MKKNYVLRKLDTAKRVTLPNGRTFVARFKRVKRSELPDNIIMRRTYRNNYAKGARKKEQVEEEEGKENKQERVFLVLLKK